MPPIPIHSNSPISAAAASKPDGATPQTDSSSNDPQAVPPPTTTSAAINAAAAYPPPRPGQPAVPAPTGAINQPYPHQMPPAPTRTYPLPEPQTDAPPPPQPGAAPVPPPPTAAAASPSTAAQAAAPPAQPQYAPPPQLSYAPPQPNQAPTHSTSFVPNPSLQPHQQPAPVDLSHPPGYSQDARASEMTAAQRAAQLQREKEDNSSRVFAGLGDASASAAGAVRAGVLSGGAGESVESGGGPAAAAEGAWGAAKQWMSGVAGKVGEMEGEVWKRVNGGK